MGDPEFKLKLVEQMGEMNKNIALIQQDNLNSKARELELKISIRNSMKDIKYISEKSELKDEKLEARILSLEKSRSNLNGKLSIIAGIWVIFTGVFQFLLKKQI